MRVRGEKQSRQRHLSTPWDNHPTVIHLVSALGTVDLRQMLKSVYMRAIQKLNRRRPQPSTERHTMEWTVALPIVLIGWLGPSLYFGFRAKQYFWDRFE